MMRRIFTAVVGLGLCGLTAHPPLHAFKPGIHKDISRDAMHTIATQVDGGRTITFTDKAIEEVRDANWKTDIGPGFFVGENHFTEDLFSASSIRLVALREQIIADITAAEPDAEAARKKLGTAHHTLQDFYAHSNWIERGNAGIFAQLGRSSLSNPPASVAVCPGNPEALPAEGGVLLTTAYYSGLLGCGPIQTAGKCYHGNTIAGCDGIHKDSPDRPFHGRARDLATEATRDYIQQILDDPRVADNDLAKKCLLGVANGTLGMVIDDTASMGTEISTVRTQVAEIINRVRGTEDEPKKYLLVRFGDPSVGPPSSTSAPNTFLARVNLLRPQGGGDCPELAMTALLQAVGASEKGSNLYFFSDASAKDAALVNSVISLAAIKRIRISFLLSGSCSPVDPAYIAIADQTGGQLFFLSPSELGAGLTLIEPQFSDDFTTLRLVKESLSGDTRVLTVPVDSTMRQVVFSVSLDSSTAIDVLDPTGTAVSTSDPSVTITDLSTGRIVIVENPVPGAWTLSASGSGTLSAAIHANSPIDFRTFDFVERVNPIHEALVPLPGEPLAGSVPLGLAFLLGEVEAVAFEMLDEAGNSLGSLLLNYGDADAAEEEFVGSVPLPEVPFRVSARGLDRNGLPFERLFPRVFRGQTVEVGIDLSSFPQYLVTDATTTLEFQVRNLGLADTFRITAASSLGILNTVRPDVVTLAAGETATVEVDLRVSSLAEDGLVISLTTTAVSTSNPAVQNSAAVELTVLDRDITPPVIHGITATPDVLWPPNHKMRTVTVDVDVTDNRDPAPSCRITGAVSNEPIAGPGSDATEPDWEIVDERTVLLRAERSGTGTGRTYSVEVECRDEAGNTATGSVEVRVPHNQ